MSRDNTENSLPRQHSTQYAVLVAQKQGVKKEAKVSNEQYTRIDDSYPRFSATH